MRISFDLDDTLILSGRKSFFGFEYLREGTIALFRTLKKQNHEVYIYTTSLRSKIYIRFLFLQEGIWVDGIINKQVHDRKLKTNKNLASKLPNHFGIHLHIDDSEGVKQEGSKHGFNVLVVLPTDIEWDKKIMNKLKTI